MVTEVVFEPPTAEQIQELIESLGPEKGVEAAMQGQMLAVGKAIAQQIGRLADAQEKVAEAIFLLAQATAGEFDEVTQDFEPPSPTGKGMGMQG